MSDVAITKSGPTKTIVASQGLTVPIPVLDEKGKQMEQTTKFRGRDVKHQAFDHLFIHANKATTVPVAIADYLIKEKFAREVDPILDEVVTGNPLAHEPWLKTGSTHNDPVNGLPIHQDPLDD